MFVELRVEELAEVVKGEELETHAGLVAEEVALHAFHEAYEPPERHSVVLFDCVDWSE